MNKVFIVKPASPRYFQVSIEDFFSDKEIHERNLMEGVTVTRYEVPSEKDLAGFSVRAFVSKIQRFNDTYNDLFEVPRKELYREFYIPKRSGGLRKIDAPNAELDGALRRLKAILEDVGLFYHTSAFAYIKGRSNVKLMQKHQKNNSKWFLKLDLSNFFGSITPAFLMKQMETIFPFSEVMKDESGKNALEKALSLAFLDGGLPQGTPLSPMLTNLIMVPIDYTLTNSLLNYHKQRFVYTRYADDFQVSSEYDFNFREIESYIKKILKEFDAPFSVNEKKTRYGSSSGSNWNLGIMLNKDGNLTVGNRRKKELKTMLFNYAKDRTANNAWSLNDIQTLNGLISYAKMIEGETIDRIVSYMSSKTKVDIAKAIREDLRG